LSSISTGRGGGRHLQDEALLCFPAGAEPESLQRHGFRRLRGARADRLLDPLPAGGLEGDGRARSFDLVDDDVGRQLDAVLDDEAAAFDLADQQLLGRPGVVDQYDAVADGDDAGGGPPRRLQRGLDRGAVAVSGKRRPRHGGAGGQQRRPQQPTSRAPQLMSPSDLLRHEPHRVPNAAAVFDHPSLPCRCCLRRGSRDALHPLEKYSCLAKVA
jgi:hypothetical protein